jgi:predicted KAP-like P-loop ATPase
MNPMQDENNQLDADLPKGREDAFNRKKFATFVLSTVQQCPSGGSFVVGIEGEWGLGKTYVFEQLKELIAQNQKTNVFVLRL